MKIEQRAAGRYRVYFDKVVGSMILRSPEEVAQAVRHYYESSCSARGACVICDSIHRGLRFRTFEARCDRAALAKSAETSRGSL